MSAGATAYATSAVRPVAPDTELVLAVDTLVGGVHFPERTRPGDVAFKAMAVNVSDLAAMGADPLEAHVSVRCPPDASGWRRAFERGLEEAASRFALPVATLHCDEGEARATVSVVGTVPRGAALLRSGARAGDRIFVTGTLGDAGLALAHLRHQVTLSPGVADRARARLERPQPRLAAGQALRGVASAAIDVSDGLCQDLGHILEASGVGAVVRADSLPLSPSMRASATHDVARTLALSAGDDYELCFTVAGEHVAQLTRRLEHVACAVTEIGEVVPGSDLALVTASGQTLTRPRGYEHFADGQAGR